MRIGSYQSGLSARTVAAGTHFRFRHPLNDPRLMVTSLAAIHDLALHSFHEVYVVANVLPNPEGDNHLP
jgi:hypothetical protein